MSMVSFLNTDITKIRFSDNIRGGYKDNFQIIEETWFEEGKVSLGGVIYLFIETYEKIMNLEEDMMKPGSFLLRNGVKEKVWRS